MDLRIALPDGFSADHERLILRYLTQGRQSLTATEWKKLLVGFDLLHQAMVAIGSGKQAFRQIYEEYVDVPLADPYLNQLLALDDVALGESSLRATMARTIVARLHQAKLSRTDLPDTK